MFHRLAFTIALTITSRFVQLRDHLLGRVPRTRPVCPELSITRHTIPSGKNLLDAIYVKPALPKSALLICHGIGEIAPQWFAVQRLLAEYGIATLVFDYSGYGRSTGHIDWLQCEHDAVSAFRYLQCHKPSLPISILGFSLGSGIAPAVLDRIQPARLILCAGYTSFRNAARAAWIPPFLAPLVPPIWSAEKALCSCSLPILIVQGNRDRLFRMQMAHGLVACSRGRARLLILPARSHNFPVYYPQPDYWSPIADWLLAAPPQFIARKR
jgi:uncharacterized protein